MKMSRCARTMNLEVHHRRCDGENGLSNAEVLCEISHGETKTYGTSGKSPESFSEEIKKKAALKRAGNQCECMRTGGCH